MWAPVRWLTFVNQMGQQAMAAGERVFEILDTPWTWPRSRTPSPCPAWRGASSCDGVSFAYGKGAPLLQEISATVRAGADAGPGGPLRVRQDHPDQPHPPLLRRHRRARCGWTATTCATSPWRSLRAQVGMVMQETFLFNLTIRENICYGRAGRHPGGGRGGGPGGGGARLHRRVPGGLRDPDRGAGGAPLGGPAPAPGHRPGHPGRPPHPDPGRGHLQRGHPHRLPHPAGPGRADAGAHHGGHRPPPVHRAAGRTRSWSWRGGGSPAGAPTPSCCAPAPSTATSTRSSSSSSARAPHGRPEPDARSPTGRGRAVGWRAARPGSRRRRSDDDGFGGGGFGGGGFGEHDARRPARRIRLSCARSRSSRPAPGRSRSAWAGLLGPYRRLLAWPLLCILVTSALQMLMPWPSSTSSTSPSPPATGSSCS